MGDARTLVGAQPDWRLGPVTRAAGLKGVRQARARLAAAKLANPVTSTRDTPAKPRPTACEHPAPKIIEGVRWCDRCLTILEPVTPA